MKRFDTDFMQTIQSGIVAGAAGGAAEIAWVSLYAQATGANVVSVARSVTTAAGVIAAMPDGAGVVAAGIAIHMALAAGLGVALALAWRMLAPRLGAGTSPYAFVLAALATVWAVNFFLVLPVIGSDFVTLMPYPVTLASKLLFGVAAAEVLRRCGVPQRASCRTGVRSAR